jgi:uncharacterized membrane protein
MYTIIGGDGKEYGPVTAEQVRSWIAGGRANMDTKIKVAGTDAWKTIAEFPEITGAATGVPAAGLVTPQSPLPAAAPTLDIISCYERSWALLKANFWPFVGVSVLMAIIYAILGYTQFRGLFFASPLFGGILSGGFYYYFLLRIRGQPATVGDMFAGFTKAFVTILVAGLVVSLFITVGLLCLIIPGIYLAIAYPFTYILAVDKGMGFWEAMETSRKVITRQWWRVFGLILLGIPFFVLGFVVLGVGVFVALPLVTGAFAYAYEDLCNPKR